MEQSQNLTGEAAFRFAGHHPLDAVLAQLGTTHERDPLGSESLLFEIRDVSHLLN